MAPEERSEIVDVLENSRRELNAAASSLSESQASDAPAPGSWSVLECLEHVIKVEERFLSQLEKAEKSGPGPTGKNKEAEFAFLVKDRTRRAQAPEPVRPTGRFTSLAEALEHFNELRDQTIRFAQIRAADLYSLAGHHPRFGPRNGLEMLLIISGHAQRHAEQMREAVAAVGQS